MTGKETGYRYLTWREVEDLCFALVKKIKASGFEPDVLVGLSRGGLVPSRILSDYLGIRTIYVIGIVFYRGVKNPNEKPIIFQDIGENIEGKNVLLVDDISDSGESLKLAIKHLMNRNVNKILITTLHYRPGSVTVPDIWAEKTDDWIIYPWEVVEDLHDLKEKWNILNIKKRYKRIHDEFF